MYTTQSQMIHISCIIHSILGVTRVNVLQQLFQFFNSYF